MDAALTELTVGFVARLPVAGRGSGAAESPQPRAEAGAVGDSISLSAGARAALDAGAAGNGAGDGRSAGQQEDGQRDTQGQSDPGAPRGADGKPLDEDESREVERLQKRDREVRAHEQAHKAAGGPYAGAPSYDYEKGPDGKSYATSGEVPIDTAPVSGDPAATIAKMETVKRAALAPAEPSSADRAIAAKAEQAKIKAQRELVEQQAEERSPDTPAPRGSLLSIEV